jgi:type II secretory pathway component GspD/PulD (secretin)
MRRKLKSVLPALVAAVVFMSVAAAGLTAPSTGQPTSPPVNQPQLPQSSYQQPAAPRSNQPVSPGTPVSPGPVQPVPAPSPADTQAQAAAKPADATNSDAGLMDSGPLVMRLKYLKVEQAKPLLAALLAEDRIKIEPNNNLLVVMGSDYEYDQIRALLAKVDIPPQQVMFETEAVEINRDAIKNLGIDWGTVTALPGTLPTPGDSFRIGLGYHDKSVYIQGTINRLIENKKGRLLASPRIAALNGQTASILIGDRLAVENTTIASGVPITSVTYVDVGIKLEITPFVNDDGTITTHIKPEVSNKTDVTKNGNPNIRTRQAETTLRVKDGQTIVLGGLIQRQETSDIFKVPLLGDIPLVGGLFRTSSTEKTETELVILLTPKMITTQ